MKDENDELRPEYPPGLIKSRVRGKYAVRYRDEGSNVALIDPDLHELFPDSDAVNRALRRYVKERRQA